MNPLDNELIEAIREISTPVSPIPTEAESRIAPLPGIRAVLFDVYGTMFVSRAGDIGTSLDEKRPDYLERAMRYAGIQGDLPHAARLGVDLIFDGIERAHAARRQEGIEYPEIDIRSILREVVDTLASRQVIDGGVPDDAIARLAVANECRINPVWPMPELCETISALIERNLILGIISNAQFYTPLLFRAFLNKTPEDLGFDPDILVWSYELLEAKPSTRLFDEAAAVLKSKHGIERSETVYVGNCMLNDIRTSKRAGMRAVHFAGDKRSYRAYEGDPRCASVRPDAIIMTLADIIDVVDNSRP